MKSAEAKSLAEVEELLQRLRVQVPQVPRSVQELEKLVEQLQSERDGLAHQLKNQSSTRLVEMVPRKQRNSCWNDPPNGEQWRRHSDKPAGLLDGLEAIGVAR